MNPNCWPVLTWIPAAIRHTQHIVAHTPFVARRVVKHYAVVPLHRIVHKAGAVKAGSWVATTACAGGAIIRAAVPPGATWTPPIPSVTLPVHPVPEPGSLVMLATALTIFFVFRALQRR
jgi:hypothetical protein